MPVFRARHHGVAPLQALFSGFAVRPNWLVYGEDMKTSRVRSDLIVSQKAFVQAAISTLPSLSIVQSEAAATLVWIHESKGVIRCGTSLRLKFVVGPTP